MRNIFHSAIAIVVLLCFVTRANSQSTSLNFPTKVSERYFSQPELDSLVKEFSKKAFEDNKIPREIFERNFELIRPLINDAVYPKLQEQFRLTESNFPLAKAGLLKKEVNQNVKQEYLKYFQRIVYNEIYENSNLRWALNFNTSDRITWFHTKINITKYGMIEVEENIKIYNGDGSSNKMYLNESEPSDLQSENDEIKRGIIRGFPTDYEYPSGFMKRVPFELTGVFRDGKQEEYFVESFENGKLIYIGNKDQQLSNGFHSYKITYTTAEQINFYDDIDEFKWNVTGNGWGFVIDSSSCEINFPDKTNITEKICYTGPEGSYDSQCEAVATGKSNTVRFKTNIAQGPYNGFTVGVHFNKGVIETVSAAKRAFLFLADNIPFVLGIFLVAIIFIIDLFSWKKYGKDPQPGTIFPQYAPPADLSPAAVGYIYDIKFKNKLVAATFVDAAVHKVITLDVQEPSSIFAGPSYHILEGTVKSREVKTGYYNFFDDVESMTGETISSAKYNSSLVSFMKRIENHQELNYRSDNNKNKVLKAMFSLNKNHNLAGNILLFIFLIPMIGFLIYLGSVLLMTYCIVLFVSALLIHIIFSILMKSYTREGQKTRDAIEGFKMYLVTADQHRLNMLNPPEKTPQLFEKYLPYAIALGVENEWGKQFDEILEKARQNNTYSPPWIRGSYSTMSGSFSSSLSSGIGSSFSGTLSSSSTPPGSSGGSGGGFSSSGGSGGGGGGGGGGGW
ncbi:MAG TPA: DUF2207 domain-containing protein [Bacteroidia bacterium]|nr:DUF2207 domain-containing protein [Bacteroidia bacterium]